MSRTPPARRRTSYRSLRGIARRMGVPLVVGCAIRREGDEMACRCGARWPVGEDHP